MIPGDSPRNSVSPSLLRAPGSAPPLVCIELTHRCPRACTLCFHWATRGARPADLPEATAQAILEKLARAGVARVRFTGGEPLLHPALLPLIERARELGLQVWLNTAGPGRGDAPWELLGRLAHDVLLPLRSPAQRTVMRAAARALARGGRVRVRFGAILTPERIAELEALVELADQAGALLEVYRIAAWGNPAGRGSERSDLVTAVDRLERLNRGRARAERVRIANAVPFCLHPDPDKVARNAFGGRFDDGRSRLVVGPDGQVRPSYVLPLILGRLPEDDVGELWHNPALVALHTRLPPACQSCRLLPLCRGGSRAEAWHATGDRFGMDPLARPHHVACI